MEPQDSNSHHRLKVFGTIAVAIAGISLAFVLVKTGSKPESQIAKPKLPSVEVNIAEVARHTYRIQSQGTALPRSSIRLVSEVSGRVISVSESFDAGRVFAKGDVLLKIDSRDYELALTQARAQVAQAELRLLTEINEAEIVRREWQLLKQDEPTGLQAREPQLASARAALEAARAAEETAKRNLDRCEIRAPFNGMVAKAEARPGQFVTLASPLGELFTTDVAEVRLPLAASDLGFINLPVHSTDSALGQAPKVTLSTQVGEQRGEWQGQLVRSEEMVDPVNRMVYVVAQVADPYGLVKRTGTPLRSGTFVRASIEGRTQENAVVLPRQALRGKDRVWVVSDNKLVFRTVKVAFANAIQVVIADGIQAGEVVITSLLAGAVNGMGVAMRELDSTNE